MPSSLVLLPDGTITTVLLPSNAQQLTTVWRHEDYFPEGVFLHKMMHINSGQSCAGLMSVSLLLDERNKAGYKLQPNFHNIPTLLDTQLFFGALLLIMTVDGTTIVPFDFAQYQSILSTPAHFPTTVPFPSPLSFPNFDEPMDISDEDDLGCRPMDISDDSPLSSLAAIKPKRQVSEGPFNVCGTD